MSDLISRADALRELNGACSNWEDDAKVQEIVMAIPSADATCATCADRALCIMSAPDGKWKACKDYRPSAEAVQGEWIDIDDYYRMATCSRCHKVTMFEKWGEYTNPYDYCPNCGSRMTKGGDTE